MKFITFSMIMFGVIVYSEASIIPSNEKNVYLLDKPISNSIYISLLPDEIPSKISQKESKDELVDSLKSTEMKEIVSTMCNQGVKRGESDIYTCAIKTVTSFITCMHVDKDGLKDTTEADPLLKCLSQAVSVFVKCLMSKTSVAVDNYAPDVVMQM